jgi:hypothetical protein
VGEGGESKEPGMECEIGRGKMRGGRDGVLAVSGGGATEGLAGLLANLPVTGSLQGLLMEGVADGNQQQGKEDQGTRNKGKNSKSASLGQPDEARVF